MTAIFLSYRRADSSASAGRISDRLQSRFGDNQVFQDVETVPLGVDFREFVAQKLEACDVLLVVMGDNWLGVVEGEEQRRIDRPDDLVRLEVEAALQREIPVIPVLVGSKPVPSEAELPDSLKNLSYRNGVEVRSDGSFDGQMTKLVAAIEAVVPPVQAAPPSRPRGGRGQLVLAAFAGIAIFVTLILMVPDEWAEADGAVAASQGTSPTPEEIVQPSWPEGEATVLVGTGYSFDTESSVTIESGRADILVLSDAGTTQFFAPHDSAPYEEEESLRDAAGGISVAPTAFNDDDCSYDYETGYARHWFEPEPNGIYCVLDRAGYAVAKVWVTHIDDSSISFLWTYFIDP
ncbi:MAG: toll/interleukin-1 receptor domain-containing protein [Halieaceae bacterium]|jgi:hypothetical protein|nr:toll/interleukin-1 receptor domain-containing protein [Halieaceae bacterium]